LESTSRPVSTSILSAVGTKAFAHWCQLKPETPEKSRCYLSLDPPKSPLRRGVGVDFEKTPVPCGWLSRRCREGIKPLRRGVGVDFEQTPVPPFLRGARGDLGLIVKQQSVTGFNVKLTPIGSWSVPRGFCI